MVLTTKRSLARRTLNGETFLPKGKIGIYIIFPFQFYFKFQNACLNLFQPGMCMLDLSSVFFFNKFLKIISEFKTIEKTF
jgi:hypothetical protein